MRIHVLCWEKIGVKQVKTMDISKRPGVGIIGCGVHATTNLLPALAFTSLNLVATCDIDPSKAKQFADMYGASKWYTNQDEMQNNEDLAGVIICVGGNQHPDLVKNAIAQRLPVFVEKPPALSVDRVEEIYELSLDSDVPVVVGFMKRFAPAFILAKEIVNDARFGQTTIFNGRLARGPGGSFRNLLYDLAIHMADLGRYFCGEVACLQAKHKTWGADRHGVVLNIEFESGSLGSLTIMNTQSWGHPVEWVEIHGEGEVVIIRDHWELRYYSKQDWGNLFHQRTDGANRMFGKGFIWQPNAPFAYLPNQSHFLNGYIGELEHFSDVICQKTKPSPSLLDSVKAIRILRAIEVSAQIDNTVSL